MIAGGCLLTALFGALLSGFLGYVVIVDRSVEPMPPPEMATVVVVATPEPMCAWVWATESLAELTAQVQDALDEAGLEASVDASAFGENCLNPDGSVRYFATMQTDFDMTVDALTDDTILAVLRVLARFPVESTPGPMPGRVTIRFADSGQQLQFQYDQGLDVLNRDLTGRVLLEALGGLQ